MTTEEKMKIFCEPKYVDSYGRLINGKLVIGDEIWFLSWGKVYKKVKKEIQKL